MYGAYREFDSRGFVAVDTEQVVEGRSPRVVCIGDSNTFGMSVEVESTFVEVLDRAFPELDVINLGVIGYSSYQALRALETKGFQLDPSLIVASFHHNDRRYVLRKSDKDSDLRFQKIYRSYLKEEIFYRIYLLRGLRLILTRLGLLGAAEQPTVRLDNLYPRVSPEEYRSNLASIATAASKAKIPLIFLLFGDKPDAVRELELGVAQLGRQEYEPAIEHLTAAAVANQWASTAAKRYLEEARRAIETNEDPASSVATTQLHSIFGGTPLYVAGEYAAIMRSVAAEYGVRLVDVGSLFAERPEEYLDYVHLGEDGQREVAEVLYDVISEMIQSDEIELEADAR